MKKYKVVKIAKNEYELYDKDSGEYYRGGVTGMNISVTFSSIVKAGRGARLLNAIADVEECFVEYCRED